MIMTVLAFFATCIAIVVYTIYSFRWFALIILFLLAFIIYIKVRREIKKYGPKSIFRAFRKYPTENEQLNLVKNVLISKIKVDLLFELESAFFIAVTKSGIYIIKVLNAEGKISGNTYDAKLVLKGERTQLISNFFIELDNIEKDIKNKVKNIIVQKMIVKKGVCFLDISYSKSYLIFGMHNFYYELQKLQRKKCYTEEVIHELDLMLSDYLSNNVKLKWKACTKQDSKLQSK
ncbi:MAG: hypothetical protein HFH08_05895 [Bacilli bacterium]|nr:hypothetical protein [Bacilli bacterium]